MGKWRYTTRAVGFSALMHGAPLLIKYFKLCFQSFRASWTFLTRIPVGGFPYPPETWTWISMWFPVVGLVLGLMYGGIWSGLLGHAPNVTAVLITVSIGFLVTGGVHEDGLADSCDAMGGGYTKADVLRILKDSRIGTFGTLGVCAVLAIKCSLLVELAHISGWVLGQSLSRVAPVVLLGVLPYADRPDGQSKSKDVARSGKIQAVVVCVFGMVISLGALQMQWVNTVNVLSMWLAVIVVTAVLGWRFHRRVGGLTGDFLGTTQQITELAILLMLTTPTGV